MLTDAGAAGAEAHGQEIVIDAPIPQPARARKPSALAALMKANAEALEPIGPTQAVASSLAVPKTWHVDLSAAFPDAAQGEPTEATFSSRRRVSSEAYTPSLPPGAAGTPAEHTAEPESDAEQSVAATQPLVAPVADALSEPVTCDASFVSSCMVAASVASYNTARSVDLVDRAVQTDPEPPTGCPSSGSEKPARVTTCMPEVQGPAVEPAAEPLVQVRRPPVPEDMAEAVRTWGALPDAASIGRYVATPAVTRTHATSESARVAAACAPPSASPPAAARPRNPPEQEAVLLVDREFGFEASVRTRPHVRTTAGHGSAPSSPRRAPDAAATAAAAAAEAGAPDSASTDVAGSATTDTADDMSMSTAGSASTDAAGGACLLYTSPSPRD